MKSRIVFRKLFHSLRARVTLLVVLITLFVAGTIGYGSWVITQKQAVTLSQNQHAQIVQALAAQAYDQVTQLRNALSRSSSELQRQKENGPVNYQKFLEYQSSLFVLFDDLLIVDTQGKVLASSNAAIALNQQVDPEVVLKLVLNSLKPSISAPYQSVLTHQKLISIAYPVFNIGKVEQIILGNIDLQRNELFINPVQRELGNTGKFSIFSPDGLYLAHQTPALIGQSAEPQIKAAIKQMRNREDLVQIAIANSHGQIERYITLQRIEDLPWILSLDVPAQTILAPIAENNRKLLIAVSIFTFLSAVLAAVLMTRSLRPIDQVRLQIESLRHNPDTAKHMFLEVSGTRELELLADEFNRLLRNQRESESLLKQALNQLKKSTDLVNEFYEYVPIGINLADGNGHFIQANKAYLDMLGYTIEELLEMTYWDTNAPEFNANQYRVQEQIRKEGKFDPFEKQLITKDKRRVDVLVRGIVLHTEEGEVYTWSIVENITERKQQKLQIEESEHRFRTLVEISSDWFWETDQNHFFIRQTAGGRISMPQAVKNSIGKRRWELNVRGPSQDDWEKHKADLNNHRPFYDFEYQSIVNDEWRWFAISGAPVFDANGQFTGYRGVGRDIHQRKLNEEALRLSRERMHMIVDSVRDVIFQTDENGNWTYLNAAWEKLTGYAIEDTLHQSCFDYLNIIGEQKHKLVLSKAQAGDSTLLRTELRHADNTLRKVELVIRQIIAPSGERIGMTGTLHDITATVRLEEERQHHARRLKLESSLSSAMLLELPDLYHSILWALKMDLGAHDCMLLLTPGNNTNTPGVVAQFGHPDFSNSNLYCATLDSQNPVVQATSQENFTEMCIPLVVDKTPLGYIYLSRIIIENTQGFTQRDVDVANLAAELIASSLQIRLLQDATDRARRTAEQSLKQMTDRFERAVAGANDGIWERNLVTGELYLSPRYKQLLGYQEYELENDRTRLFELVHPSDRETFETYTNTMLNFGKRWQYDIRMRTKLGEYRWFRVRSIAERNAKGEAILLSGTFSDVHEVKIAEDELKRHRDSLAEMVAERTAKLVQARDEAQQANQSKSEFLANMSHELRTPMHAILSFAKFGVDKWEKVEKDKLLHYFENIYKSGSRLLTLLNDLLDLSKLEAGKMVMNLQLQSLASLIQEAFLESEALAKTKQLQLLLDNQLSNDQIQIDGPRILQVLRNLLSNAIKFSPEGASIIVHLHRTTVPSGRRATDLDAPGVLIAIEDQGIGIPDDELEVVFDKFVQSSKTKTGAGGTGLGLAICREIIEAHQGRISARNNASAAYPQQPGASFELKLPLKQEIDKP